MSNLVFPLTSNNNPDPHQALASSEYDASHKAFNAFDGVAGTYWCTTVADALTSWLFYDWNYGDKKVGSYSIQCRSDDVDTAPKNWTLAGYDGADWINVDTVTNVTGWSAGEVKTFTVDDPGLYESYSLSATANNGATVTSIAEIQYFPADGTKYRFLITGIQSGSTASIGEVTLRSTPSGADEASNVTGAALVRSYYSATTMAGAAVDDILTNMWAGDDTDPYPYWEFDFYSDVDIVEYVIMARDDSYYYQTPIAWDFQKYNDGTEEWVTLESEITTADWTAGESRTFTTSIIFSTKWRTGLDVFKIGI